VCSNAAATARSLDLSEAPTLHELRSASPRGRPAFDPVQEAFSRGLRILSVDRLSAYGQQQQRPPSLDSDGKPFDRALRVSAVTNFRRVVECCCPCGLWQDRRPIAVRSACIAVNGTRTRFARWIIPSRSCNESVSRFYIAVRICGKFNSSFFQEKSPAIVCMRAKRAMSASARHFRICGQFLDDFVV